MAGDQSGPQDLCDFAGLERVALNRVNPIERNRNIPGLCWSWIAFNLNEIEGNPLWGLTALAAPLAWGRSRAIGAVRDRGKATQVRVHIF